VKNDLEKAREALNAWKALRRDKIEPLGKCLACKPVFELEYFRQAVLYRFIELAEATFVLLEVGNCLGAVVTVRSLQETFSVMWYLNEKCMYVVKKKDLTHFTEQLNRLMLGWKDDDLFPQPVQILNLIDKVDKRVSGYRKHYDSLSEYVHPNWKGTMGLFAKTGGKRLKVDFAKYIRGRGPLVKHIETTLIVTMGLLSLVQNEYEDIVNKVLEVCYEIYDKGELNKQIQPTRYTRG
jgi:hypothetical protein